MNQRKDSYRAALQRGNDTPAPRSVKVTTLNSRYIRVTVEVDPALRQDVTQWITAPVSALALAGATVVRLLGGRPASPEE
jgi:hypothetical protein